MCVCACVCRCVCCVRVHSHGQYTRGVLCLRVCSIVCNFQQNHSPSSISRYTLSASSLSLPPRPRTQQDMRTGRVPSTHARMHAHTRPRSLSLSTFTIEEGSGLEAAVAGPHFLPRLARENKRSAAQYAHTSVHSAQMTPARAVHAVGCGVWRRLRVRLWVRHELLTTISFWSRTTGSL